MKLVHWLGAVLLLVTVSVQSRSLPEFTQLIEEHSPAVVKINTIIHGNAGARPNIQVPDGVPEIFRHFFDPRQMPERDARSMGSGFFISDDGYILTNNHVIDKADEILVRLIDRREYEATVVGTDPQSDLALLKIDAKGMPFLKLADSDKTKVGEWVLAIGSPFGLDYSVSAGIISAIGRSIPSDGNQNYVPFIQTDVAINPGNSGGPLFNLDGEVVGINSQIYTRSGGSIGLSFAIPANLARDVVAQLKETGRVERGWLGVVIQDVDKNLALSFGLKKPQGALIAQLEPGGPADKSGLQVSDIILTFNGRAINTSSDLPHAVGPIRPGSEVSVKIIRKGKRQTLDVTVGKRSSEGVAAVTGGRNNQAGQGGGRLGLVVENLTDAQRHSSGIAGVVIVNIAPDSAAANAGLRVGDIVVQLGFDEIASLTDFVRVQKSLPVNKPQPIRVIRQGNSVFRSIIIKE